MKSKKAKLFLYSLFLLNFVICFASPVFYAFTSDDKLKSVDQTGKISDYDFGEESFQIIKEKSLNDSPEHSYGIFLVPQKSHLILYKQGKNESNLEPGDGLLYLRENQPIYLGDSVPLKQDVEGDNVKEVAKAAHLEANGTPDFTVLPMMKFNQTKLNLENMVDMLSNNEKILDIMAFEMGEKDGIFFNFSNNNEIKNDSLEDFTLKYLKEWRNIIEKYIFPIYEIMIDEEAKRLGRYDNIMTPVANCKNVVLKKLQEYGEKLIENHLMLSYLKGVYNNQLSKTLSVENLQAAFHEQIGDHQTNLLAQATSQLIHGSPSTHKISLQSPWALTNAPDQTFYVKNQMLENIYHLMHLSIQEKIDEFLQAGSGGHPLLTNQSLFSVSEDALEMVIKKVQKIAKEQIDQSFSTQIYLGNKASDEFKKMAGLSKFLVKNALNNRVKELQKFIDDYTAITLERTFFSDLVNGQEVDRKKFLQMNQLIEPSSDEADIETINFPYLTDMDRRNRRVQKKKSLIVI